MIIRSEGHLAELTVMIWKQYRKCLWKEWLEKINQRSAFGRKSWECDGMISRSEVHLAELKVPVSKQYDEWLGK